MFDSTQEAQGWGVIQTDASPAWSITNGPYSTGTAFEEDPMFHFENAVTSGLFDPSSANKLLRLVGVMIVRGDDVPPAIRRWLGCALIAIGLGAPPASTLRIGAKKGRPARVDWQDVFSRFHPRFASGMALHTACAEIADELSAETGSNVDEKTIRNLYHDRFEFLYSLLTPDDASIEGVEDWIFDNLLAIEEFRASMDPFVNFNRSVTKI